MQFESFNAFLHMGGYGFYVWLSFGVSLFALLWLAVDGVRQRARLFDAVEKEQARKARILAAKAAKASSTQTPDVARQHSSYKEESKS